jgi:hypothetical protein
MGKRKSVNSDQDFQAKKKPPTNIIVPIVPSKPKVKSPVKMAVQMEEGLLSPSSKITVFKVDVFLCNGRDLSQTELAAPDLEKIWTEGIIRPLTELSGYSSMKVKNNSEIRIQYQLSKPMSIRDVALEAEFNFERAGARGVEILRCKVVGLSNLRPAEIGERVKVSVIKPNFDITPEQAIEWLSHFGRVHEGHRCVALCSVN